MELKGDQEGFDCLVQKITEIRRRNRPATKRYKRFVKQCKIYRKWLLQMGHYVDATTLSKIVREYRIPKLLMDAYERRDLLDPRRNPSPDFRRFLDYSGWDLEWQERELARKGWGTQEPLEPPRSDDSEETVFIKAAAGDFSSEDDSPRLRFSQDSDSPPPPPPNFNQGSNSDDYDMDILIISVDEGEEDLLPNDEDTSCISRTNRWKMGKVANVGAYNDDDDKDSGVLIIAEEDEEFCRR